MKLSIFVMIIKVPVALTLMRWFGLMGLPLSHAVTVTFEVVIMIWILSQRLGGWKNGIGGQLFRTLLAALCMGAGLVAIDGLMPPFGALRVILICGIGVLVFALFSFALQIRALFPLLDRIRRRMAPSPPSGAS